MKFRRSMAAFAAIATIVASLTIAATASAQPTRPQAPTAPQLDNDIDQGYGNCVDITTQNIFTGRILPKQSAWYSMKAVIDITSNEYNDCVDTSGTDYAGGSSSWVGITPGGTDGTKILQIGLGICSGLGYPACPNNDDTPHYWWADGGCNANLPNPQDLGPATWAPHNFTITSNDTRYYLQIDGVTKVAISKTAPSINCWINSVASYQWLSERWDRGDGLGNYLDPAVFSSMAIGYNGGWHAISIAGCTSAEGGGGGYGYSYCSASGSTMSMYTMYH